MVAVFDWNSKKKKKEKREVEYWNVHMVGFVGAAILAGGTLKSMCVVRVMKSESAKKQLGLEVI